MNYNPAFESANVVLNGVPSNNAADVGTGFRLGYYAVLGYKPVNRLSINLKSSESFHKDFLFISNQIGCEYIFCLKNGGKQFFMLPGAGYALTTSGVNIGRLTFTENTTIAEKKFKKGTHVVYSGKKNHAFAFNLKFKTDISKRLSLTIGADYLLPFIINDNIVLKEDFGLFKKRVNIPIHNNQVEYYENGLDVKNTGYSPDNFTFQAGIRFEL